MKTQIIDLNQASSAPKGTVLSLGCFDGIHLGHQKLIQKLILSARKHKRPSCLCLFDPLPFQVLKAQNSFKRLFTIEETKKFLEDFGLDFFCIIPFNKDFSKLKAREFVEDFLIRLFDPLHIVVGYDFSFAYQRQGDFSLLKKLSEEFSFGLERVSAYVHKKEPVSSSRIRECLALAEMKEVQALLGRPFSIQAQVVRGKGRGRKLGFPTANLRVKQKELPALGVYRGQVEIQGSWRKAVINIGRQPTFSPTNSILVEVHIIKSHFDLYGRDLNVQIHEFIRKEKIFSSSLELKKAIQKDIKKVLSLSS